MIFCLIWLAIYNIDMEAASAKKKIEPIIPPKEQVYLEGPKSRTYELAFAWRVFKQFIKGFRSLHFMGPCITVLVRPALKKTIRIMKVPAYLVNVLPKPVLLL
jgi:hypothetical protein